MQTKTYTVYTFDELSPEAQQRAIKEYHDNDDMPFLADDMNEYAHELIEANNIKLDKTEIGTDYAKRNWNNFSEKYRCFFDLSYSQGDGAIIELEGQWKKYRVTVKQRGNYSTPSHCTITLEHLDNPDKEVPEKAIEQFTKLYEAMCDELKKRGYREIEHQASDEYISEILRSNNCFYTAKGKVDTY